MGDKLINSRKNIFLQFSAQSTSSTQMDELSTLLITETIDNTGFRTNKWLDARAAKVVALSTPLLLVYSVTNRQVVGTLTIIVLIYIFVALVNRASLKSARRHVPRRVIANNTHIRIEWPTFSEVHQMRKCAWFRGFSTDDWYLGPAFARKTPCIIVVTPFAINIACGVTGPDLLARWEYYFKAFDERCVLRRGLLVILVTIVTCALAAALGAYTGSIVAPGLAAKVCGATLGMGVAFQMVFIFYPGMWRGIWKESSGLVLLCWGWSAFMMLGRRGGGVMPFGQAIVQVGWICGVLLATYTLFSVIRYLVRRHYFNPP
jgi:hypothetical protein